MQPEENLKIVDFARSIWNLVPGSINEGWAILIAALLGFAAVAYQTRIGFISLRNSHVAQAKADRDAREHQAEVERMGREHQQKLAREAEARQNAAAARTLKHALAAELHALLSRVHRSVPLLKQVAAGYRKIGLQEIDRPVDASAYMVVVDPVVYNSNADKLGLLGPSVASDVITLYSTIRGNKRELPALTGFNGDMLAVVFEAWSQSYENWILDQDHVVRRLLLADGQPDIGSLLEAQEARTRANQAEKDVQEAQ